MSDEITITGTVEKVFPTETFPSGFSKRVLVINTGGDYPQTIPVEFIKDKTSVLDGVSNGQNVTASVNLRGNEYNGRYFANIQGWKLEKSAGSPSNNQVPDVDEDEDDIPF